MEIKFISLFAGIGGKDWGLERAGMECVAQVEIDPFCQLILEKHWPNVPRWKDVRKFSVFLWRKYCEAYGIDPRIDLICGGFPCQDLSTAGQGKGLAGTRSGLWFEMLRTIRQFRPRWVLVENVPALRIRGADTVLSGLEKTGYTCWPVVVGAEAVGAPHRRNRIWIICELGHTNGVHLQGRCPAGFQAEARSAVRYGEVMAHSHVYRIPTDQNARPKSTELVYHCGGRWPARPGEQQQAWEPCRVLTQQPVGGDLDGIPTRILRLNNSHALRAYGNSVVPDIVLAIGKAIAARHEGLI